MPGAPAAHPDRVAATLRCLRRTARRTPQLTVFWLRKASFVTGAAPLNTEWCRAAANSMRTVIRSCRSPHLTFSGPTVKVCELRKHKKQVTLWHRRFLLFFLFFLFLLLFFSFVLLYLLDFLFLYFLFFLPPSRWTAKKIALFPYPATIFHSLFPLLGVFSWNFEAPKRGPAEGVQRRRVPGRDARKKKKKKKHR